jgi:biotin operon repressor
MKTEWICTWQLIPGGKEHREAYPTMRAAHTAMAKVLTSAVPLNGYVQLFRNEEGEDCIPSADFLKKFFSDLMLPEQYGSIPPHWDIPDYCNLALMCDEIRWEYMRGECPTLVARMDNVDPKYPLIIDFSFDNPQRISADRVNAVYIRIESRIDYGTSAYPLMVWDALRKQPKTQEQIVRTISEVWDTEIERKSVGRHLELLKNLGYPVQHGPNGYYWGGDFCEPMAYAKVSSSAYPLMILRILDGTPKTQTAIIQMVQQKYGVKMDRKAVSRHLNLLNALGFQIQKNKEGYYR